MQLVATCGRPLRDAERYKRPLSAKSHLDSSSGSSADHLRPPPPISSFLFTACKTNYSIVARRITSSTFFYCSSFSLQRRPYHRNRIASHRIANSIQHPASSIRTGDLYRRNTPVLTTRTRTSAHLTQPCRCNCFPLRRRRSRYGLHRTSCLGLARWSHGLPHH